MTPQQVSQFIATYGLPPPPNQYNPKTARLPYADRGVASIMSTPRGMRIGRRQESLGPDIEGGEYDELFPEPPQQPSQPIIESSSENLRKQKKRTKRVEVDPSDEADPDLQLVRRFVSFPALIMLFQIKEPVVPLWLSTIVNEMYNRLLRLPVVYVIQSLAISSQASLSNPVTLNTVNDPLQLSDVILDDEDPSNSSPTSGSLHSPP